MRQVFLRKPWIHHEEPDALKAIYLKYGKPVLLKSGSLVRNGGENGQFCLLRKGLGTFSFSDLSGHVKIFSLIIPNRVLADIDGTTGDIVNVVVRVIRDSEVLAIDRATWKRHVFSNPELMLLFTQSVLGKEECHMEAMIANYTLDVEARLKVFLKALITSFPKGALKDWDIVPLRLSNEEYAAMISASRVTVSKLFSKWMDEGLLEKRGRDIKVHSSLLSDVYDWIN